MTHVGVSQCTGRLWYRSMSKVEHLALSQQTGQRQCAAAVPVPRAGSNFERAQRTALQACSPQRAPELLLDQEIGFDAFDFDVQSRTLLAQRSKLRASLHDVDV